jgi:hypothetical protein
MEAKEYPLITCHLLAALALVLLGCASLPSEHSDAVTGNEVLVACYDSGKLHDHNTEDITQAKIDDVKQRMADNQIRIKITTDPHAQLAAWGLEAPVSDEL